jgi:preprotein translocase subunit SecA
MFQTILKKVLGTKHQREVKRMQPMVSAISELEPEMKKLSDAQLRGKTADFRQQLDNRPAALRRAAGGRHGSAPRQDRRDENR